MTLHPPRREVRDVAIFGAPVLALLLGLMAPGCDDDAVQPFGGNTRGPTGEGGKVGGGGVGGNGALERGGGGTSAILPAATGGAAGGTAGHPAVASATGGAPGTGGGLGGTTAVGVATGGVSGVTTGGVSGSAGARAAGGTPMSGTPTGGATVGGPGGAPAPGAGGAGSGEPAGSANACAQYVADYETALAKAKECTGKGDECGKAVPAALTGCRASCMTYVEDDAALKDIRRLWDKAGCVSQSCAAVVCISSAASCDTSGIGKDDRGAKKGICSDNLIVL